MARKRPRLACSNAVRIFPDLWLDERWLDLSGSAQLLYIALCCQPRTSTGPTIALDVDLWASFNVTSGPATVRSTLGELQRAGWIAISAGEVRLLRLQDIMLPSAATECDRERARVTVAVRRAVFDRDGEVCRACGVTEDLAIDHVIALAVGGTSDLENLAVLCRRCNGSKGSKPWDEWIAGRA